MLSITKCGIIGVKLAFCDFDVTTAQIDIIKEALDMNVIKTLVYEGVEPQDGEIYRIESIKRKDKRVICKLIKENSDYLNDASPVIYLLNQPTDDEPLEAICKIAHQENKKVKPVYMVYAKYVNGMIGISFIEKKTKKPKKINQ